MATSKEQLKAANNICRNLDITIQQFFNKIDEYNKRVDELNQITVDYVKNFLAPKAIRVKGELEFDLNNDDKAILSGYKENMVKTLQEEFPELYENWDDLKMFLGTVNTDQYL